MGKRSSTENMDARAEGSAPAENPGAEKERAARRVYIGPPLKGVSPGAVFLNGLAPALEEAVRELPAVAELVVPVAGLREAIRDLADPDSALSRFYRMVEAEKGRGKES